MDREMERSEERELKSEKREREINNASEKV